MYSSYAQMYEQYYMSQGQVVLSTELCCYAVSPVQLHLSSVEWVLAAGYCASLKRAHVRAHCGL